MNGGPIGPTKGHAEFHPPPPPPPPPPLALYVPAALLAGATDEEVRRIGLIETKFAQAVATLVAQTYGEIIAVLNADANAPR